MQDIATLTVNGVAGAESIETSPKGTAWIKGGYVEVDTGKKKSRVPVKGFGKAAESFRDQLGQNVLVRADLAIDKGEKGTFVNVQAQEVLPGYEGSDSAFTLTGYVVEIDSRDKVSIVKLAFEKEQYDFIAKTRVTLDAETRVAFFGDARTMLEGVAAGSRVRIDGEGSGSEKGYLDLIGRRVLTLGDAASDNAAGTDDL